MDYLNTIMSIIALAVRQHHFSPADRVARKRSPMQVLHVFSTGQLELYLGRRRHCIKQPSAWVTGPQTASFSYRFGAQGASKWYLGFSGPCTASWEARGLLLREPQPLRDLPVIEARLPLLTSTGHRTNPQANQQRALLLEELLLEIAVQTGQSPTPLGEWTSDLVTSFANEHCEPPDVDSLARQHDCSPTTLRRRFLAATGHTLNQAWNQARLELGARLLASEADSISSIAKRCGFDDPLYFSRRFSQHFGLAPRSYRRHLAATNDLV